MGVTEDRFAAYARRVGILVLGIARKSVLSGLDPVETERLRAPQAALLIDLMERGTLTTEELAGGSRLHPRATRSARRLAREGLVEKTRGEQDGGVTRIWLTEKGMKTAEKLIGGYVESVENALRGTSEKERENLLTLLTLVDDSLLAREREYRARVSRVGDATVADRVPPKTRRTRRQGENQAST
jgi:DNA-binding MarR family transcriptional regulator